MPLYDVRVKFRDGNDHGHVMVTVVAAVPEQASVLAIDEASLNIPWEEVLGTEVTEHQLKVNDE